MKTRPAGDRGIKSYQGPDKKGRDPCKRDPKLSWIGIRFDGRLSFIEFPGHMVPRGRGLPAGPPKEEEESSSDLEP